MQKILSLLIVTFLHFVAMASNQYYVDPDTIHIGQDGIFLNQDGSLIPISALAADEDGIYIPLEAGYCFRHGSYPGTSLCPKCYPEHPPRNNGS